MKVEPRVWLLLGKGAGGNAQMRELGRALGWPLTEKRIVYNALNRIPNLLLGASRIGVDRRRSEVLEPPWPDLVIAASRRSAPVARWIKKQSGGHTRLVHLFHTQAPLAAFDLVITLPQYRLPERANLLHLTGALNRVDPARLAEAAARWEPELRALPRPWIALVAGGDSSSYRFDPDTAAHLAREASALARARGGALLVSTTPRTAEDSARRLFATIDVPAYRYAWRPDDPANPYLGLLALADLFIVTVDSASLPMEACAAGKPVRVFEWSRRNPMRSPLERMIGARYYAGLVYLGLVKPPRDFAAYHRALRERGLTGRLSDRTTMASGQVPDDLSRAVARVRSLFDRSPTGTTS